MATSLSHRPPLQNLQSMYDEKTLCDITVVVCGREFQAHKVILAACSDYFKLMFTSEMQEQSLAKVELKCELLTSDSFDILLKYAYSGNLVLSSDNVFDVITAADHLQIVSAVETCCQFIIKSCLEIFDIKVGDCLAVATYADKYSQLEYLGKTLNKTLAKNFVKVMAYPDTCEQLSYERLCSLLELDSLCASSELQILQTLLKWLRHNWEHRMQFAADLLGKVRFGLIDKYDLVELLEVDDIQQIPECKELYYKAMVYHALPDRNREPCDLINQPRASCLALVSINTVVMQYYDRNTMRWVTLPKFVNNSTGRQITGFNAPAVVAHGNFIYVAGGNIQGPTCNLSRYDIGRNAWDKLAPMKSCRFAFSLCIFDGYMYAVGGYSDSGYLAHNNAERFNFITGHWQYIGQLNTPRFHVAVTPYQGFLYAVGGQKDKFTALKSVQRFDPAKNTWETLNPTIHAHTQASLMEIDGKLYVSGGKTNGPDRSSDLINSQTVEVYDGKTDCWRDVPQDLIPPGNIPAVNIGSDVYIVLNGYTYKTGIQTTPDQVYYVDLDDWANVVNFIRGLSITCVPINVERLIDLNDVKDSKV
ncbi:kelch-like protein 26 [Saccoglossus kowalevskii]|uniref:Kelch-like protein 17-like n=1 Tax=Saccoglossus kowalevskii TaxID=10224 RepID=A0ABM0GV81_SACKO|nr:PREDICTED: kelch-like protein 17-like [Saccoglossus kowalevskii]